MKYAGYMPNDFINGEGVCVSLWVSGCTFRCPGCHNPELWDYNYGEEVTHDLIDKLHTAINANGIKRNFSILGGEPLAPGNIEFTVNVLKAIRSLEPNITIYLWTGFTIEQLKNLEQGDFPYIKPIFESVDVIIDGRYEQDKRDITLKLRGSSNQRILYKGKDF